MKKVILLSSAILMTIIITSCGGDDCYKCRQRAYHNGINTTATGDWGIVCKKKGESDSDFEERIAKKRESDYECKPR